LELRLYRLRGMKLRNLGVKLLGLEEFYDSSIPLHCHTCSANLAISICGIDPQLTRQPGRNLGKGDAQ
jgi:hypothetical protein